MEEIAGERERQGESNERKQKGTRRELKLKRESKEWAKLLCDYTVEDACYLCVHVCV